MRHKWFLTLIGVLLLSVPLVVQAQSLADWTIIYYSAADNDLEQFMIGDLIEMQLVGSTDRVHIVVQMDRAEGYDDVNGTWTDARRFYVTPPQTALSTGDFAISREAALNRVRSLDAEMLGMTQGELNELVRQFANATPEELEQVILAFNAPPGGGEFPVGLQLQAEETLGEVNSGDPRALIEFATWAIERYPAERYMLIISNHGGGWTGVAFDEASENDSLTLPELESALNSIIQQSGIGKFDLVAFDACLMGQLEVYKSLAPYARYTIASQEVIPGAGWEYVTPLRSLIANPGMDSVGFGKLVVDGYMDYYTHVLTSYKAFDLHVVDLTLVDELTAALDAFSAAVQANPVDNLRAVGRARANAQLFSADSPEDAAYYASTDLVDFMRLLIQLTPDAAVQQAAQQVIAAAQRMVVYGAASPSLPGSNGIAVYFPANVRDFALAGNNQRYAQQVPGAMASWQAFLATFHGTAVETFRPEALSINITQVIPSDGTASIYDPPVVLFETDGQGIVGLQFFAALLLDDEVYVILDQSPLEFTTYTPDGEAITEFPEGLSSNEFTWNVEMPVLTDGVNTQPVVLLSNPDNPDEAAISGIYRWRSGGEARAFLIVNLETRQVTSVFGITAGAEGQATGEIRPERGDTFEPHWRILNENGEIELLPTETRLVFNEQPFAFDFQPAASGSYLFTMWVEDMAGNISLSSVAFDVDNEGLDTSYRGFQDVQTGINFLYPWGWDDPSVTTLEDGSYSLSASDPEGQISIIVDTFDVSSLDELVEIAIGNLEAFGADYAEPEAFTLEALNGEQYDAYLVTYTYINENGVERAGAQLVVYVAENEIGFVVDVDSDVARVEEASVVLENLIRNILFFPRLQ